MSPPSPDSILSRFEHAVVLVAYTVLALAASYPLVTQFGDHIAGVDGDVWSYLWALGWARVSVLNLAANPFHTEYVYYPLGGATQLLWGTALPSFASIPLQLAFGLAPAFNLVYLASSVLTAYGMYLLGKDELRMAYRLSPIAYRESGTANRPVQLAAFVVGMAFTFSALRLGYGLAFTNLFHTEFIPFYVLFLLRATRTRGWKNAILAGFFFACSAYVDFQIAAFLALFTALWFIFVLARALVQDPQGFRRASDSMRASLQNPAGFVARWLIMLMTAGVLVLPMLGVVLNDFAIEGGNYIRVYPLKYSTERSYDALAYVLPNARSTLYQNLPAPKIENVNASVGSPDESEMSPDRQSFLGLTLLALAVVGIIRFRRTMLFWILATLLFALLSLGPILHVAGYDTGVPMPFALANAVPILNNIRIPMRYGLMVFFGASMLAGAGAYVLLQWRQWLIVPILALLFAETLVLPYPTLEFRAPRVYEQIAQMPDDATVLEIPGFHWRFAAKNEAYQAVHQKRILRAYTNRIAPDLAEYFNLRQTPIVVRSLRILEGAEDGILTEEEMRQDRAALSDTLAFFDLRYAVLHRDQLPAERVSQINAYLRDVLGAQVFYQDDAVTAYQFNAPSRTKHSLQLDLADNAALMYLGRGWQIEPLADEGGQRGRYLKGVASEIYLPPSAAETLTLRVFSPEDSQRLVVDWNGAPLPEQALRAGWADYVFQIPKQFSRTSELNLVRLHQSAQPRTLAISSLELK